jgi:hypothetical protein
MKPNTLLFLIILSSFNSFSSFSQTIKTVTINKRDFGYGVGTPGMVPTITAYYEKDINIDSEDTIKKILIVFRDARYSQLIETESILFSNIRKDKNRKALTNENQDVWMFIKHFTEAIAQINSKEKASMKWLGNNYAITTSESDNKWISLWAIESDVLQGYTLINKKWAEQLIDWFKQIGFDYSVFQNNVSKPNEE